MKPIPITTRKTDKLRAAIRRMRGSSAPTVADWRNGLAAELNLATDPMRRAANAALAAVNKSASTFTINDFVDVLLVAERAEDELQKRAILKRDRIGATCDYQPAGPTARAYKYRVIGTRISLLRVRDGWRLTGAERVELLPRQREKFTLTTPAVEPSPAA